MLLNMQLTETQVHMTVSGSQPPFFTGFQSHAKHTDTGKITCHVHQNMYDQTQMGVQQEGRAWTKINQTAWKRCSQMRTISLPCW